MKTIIPATAQADPWGIKVAQLETFVLNQDIGSMWGSERYVCVLDNLKEALSF